MPLSSKKPLAFLFFCITVICGCRKEPIVEILPDFKYPSTYQKIISPQEWEIKSVLFLEINTNENFYLNKQGFLEGKVPYETDSLTLESIIHEVQTLIDRYSFFMGIPEGQTFNLENELLIRSPLLTPAGSTSISNHFYFMELIKEADDWEYLKDKFRNPQFFLKQRTIEGQQFLGPDLIFNFDETNQTIKISGNWFPTALNPKNEIFSKNDATVITYRVLLKETGKDFWEEKHMWNFRKVFLLASDNETDRIHECWQLVTKISEYEHFYIYIDTQTGNVVSQFKRWVMM